MAGTSLPAHEAGELCRLGKAASPASWAKGAQEGSAWCEFGVVCEPPRRGLLVSIRINRGHKIKRRTMNFGLWDTSTGSWERVYQLTIADPQSPTHSENGETWFGSHEHVGPEATQRMDLDSADFQSALQVFCEAVRLRLEDPIHDPLDPKQFRLE